MKHRRMMLVVAALSLTVACRDNPLEVTNVNNPDTERALNTPGDVESIIGSSFALIHSGHFNNNDALWPQLLVMGLENLSANSNFNMATRGGMPRVPVDNNRGRQNAASTFRDFQFLQRAARSAANGLARINAGITFPTQSRTLRARAFAHFVIGVANGEVGLAYDSAAIVNERAEQTPPLSSGPDMVAAGIASLDSAIATASAATGANTFTLETSWLSGHTAFNQDSLVRLARSYRARFRAQVHRDSLDRKNMNWAEVIADATNGIASDFRIALSPGAGWNNTWFGQHRIFDNWHQAPYFFYGMADTSGGYETWVATPLASKNNVRFVIQTRDLRFPAGADRAAQVANSGGGTKTALPGGRRYLTHRDPGFDFGNQPGGESFYWHVRFLVNMVPTVAGEWPIMTKAEIDLLAAEGYMRTGNMPAGIAILNTYRALNGLQLIPAGAGLNDPVPGGAGCIPRVPAAPSFATTKCGTVFDALKYESRMETANAAWGAWYFNGRGWGDLPEGTPTEFPVPQQELDTRAMPLYELGGVGNKSAAPKGNYGF